MREQIGTILNLVGDAVMHLSGCAVRATKSSLDTKVVSVIQAVLNRALAKDFRRAAFYTAVQGAVQKYVPEPRSFYEVATNGRCLIIHSTHS